MAGPGFAFDGAPVNAPGAKPDTALPIVSQPAAQALTAQALKKTAVSAPATADVAPSLNSLQYAAEGGHPVAQWKLGRMYADGDGVPMNKGRAYDYFKRLTLAYGEDSAGTSYAPFVSKAFVNLGRYYSEGIPGTVAADPVRGREAFRYAASYFGDAEAQYYLGRMYLLGDGGQKNAKEAARWLSLSAEKGDARAQALLGEMLIKGREVPRQAARGLFWLIVAKDGAGADEPWISEVYTAALAQANENDRALAHKYLEDWLKKRP